jgi:hypothetical protein
MGLTAIPKHFGEGGSGLTPDGSSGRPCLRDILEEHRAVLEGGSAAGVSPTHHVRAASTANIASLAAASTTMDGVTLVAGDRVLLKNQSTASQNGIYTVGTVAAGAAPLTRSGDFDVAGEAQPNVLVAVAEGTANADKVYALTTNAPITLGTTNLTFAQTASGGEQSGTATLVLGTVTVPATVTAGSRVFLTRTVSAGTTDTVEYAVPTKTPGAPGSFVIQAQVAAGTINVADTSTLDWLVVG